MCIRDRPYQHSRQLSKNQKLFSSLAAMTPIQEQKQMQKKTSSKKKRISIGKNEGNLLVKRNNELKASVFKS